MAKTLVDVSRRLRREVDALSFSAPITHVYNPLDYARGPHEAYLEKYGAGPKRVIFVGMNPGPFGMAQTGVPFGEVAAARDYLGLAGKVKHPAKEHPKRPVTGFDCTRSEVSGARVWGWVKERYGKPEKFFKHCFVANHCPLVFMEASGKNFTPDKLPRAEQDALYEACDRALLDTIRILSPQWVIGIGAYAEERARMVTEGMNVQVGRVLHPSPASPLANRGWAAQADKDLAALGVKLF